MGMIYQNTKLLLKIKKYCDGCVDATTLNDDNRILKEKIIGEETRASQQECTF